MFIDVDRLREQGLYRGPLTNETLLAPRGSASGSFSPKIRREFDAFRAQYPNSPELKRIGKQLDDGVRLNDNVLTTTMARVAESNITPGAQPTNPITSRVDTSADYTGATLTGNDKVDNRTRRLIDLGLSPEAASSANEVLIREAAIPFEEGGGLQAPKGAGPGLFGTALGILGGLATLGVGLPAGLGVAGSLFNMGAAANAGDPIGAFGSLLGAGITDAGGLEALTSGGGFTNPGALGGDPLSLFASEALGEVAPAAAGGVNLGALGLDGAQLGIDLASLPGAFPKQSPAPTQGANAVGGDPLSLYAAESLGETAPTPSSNTTENALEAAKTGAKLAATLLGGAAPVAGAAPGGSIGGTPGGGAAVSQRQGARGPGGPAVEGSGFGGETREDDPRRGPGTTGRTKARGRPLANSLLGG